MGEAQPLQRTPPPRLRLGQWAAIMPYLGVDGKQDDTEVPQSFGGVQVRFGERWRQSAPLRTD